MNGLLGAAQGQTKKVWRLFPALSAPMPLQMTLDRVIFENYLADCAAGAETKPLLRIFYSSEKWVSVGYAAEKKAGYALERSKHHLEGLPVCRRITGGGTVLHGQDLIFSFFARKEDDVEKFSTVESSYLHLHKAVQLALKKLGVDSEFYRDRELPAGRDCFLFPVETDLRVGNQKVAGGAQKRSENYFLHEESIQPPNNVRLDDLENALLEAIEEYFGIVWERQMLNPQVLFAAQKSADDCVLIQADSIV